MFLYPIKMKEDLDCSQCPQNKKKEPPSNSELSEKINNLSTNVNLLSSKLNITEKIAQESQEGVNEINAKIKKFKEQVTKQMKEEAKK